MAFILIVDDEKSIRTMLASYVRTLGHEVEIAEDGKAALEILGRTAFDLVFSDVRMADLDGLALLREIRATWPGVVVVLMTAYATVPQAVEAIRAGAYDYLVKPFSILQVDHLLDRALEMQALRVENRPLRPVLGQPALQAPPEAVGQEATVEPSLSLDDVERRHLGHVLPESASAVRAVRVRGEPVDENLARPRSGACRRGS
jgi:DNA-binding NtrC family response regulator